MRTRVHLSHTELDAMLWYMGPARRRGLSCYGSCGDRGSAVLTRSQVPWIRAAGTDAVSLLSSMRVGGGWAAGVLTFAWLTKAGMHA